MGPWFHPDEHLTLEEMLDEPIVQLLMARDGVTRAEIEMLVERLRMAQMPCRPMPVAAACPEAVSLPVAEPWRCA